MFSATTVYQDQMLFLPCARTNTHSLEGIGLSHGNCSSRFGTVIWFYLTAFKSWVRNRMQQHTNSLVWTSQQQTKSWNQREKKSVCPQRTSQKQDSWDFLMHLLSFSAVFLNLVASSTVDSTFGFYFFPPTISSGITALSWSSLAVVH